MTYMYHWLFLSAVSVWYADLWPVRFLLNFRKGQRAQSVLKYIPGITSVPGWEFVTCSGCRQAGSQPTHRGGKTGSQRLRRIQDPWWTCRAQARITDRQREGLILDTFMQNPKWGIFPSLSEYMVLLWWNQSIPSFRLDHDENSLCFAAEDVCKQHGRYPNLKNPGSTNDNHSDILDCSGVPQEEEVIGSLKRRPLFVISRKMTL